jgi:hypothetical protein
VIAGRIERICDESFTAYARSSENSEIEGNLDWPVVTSIKKEELCTLMTPIARNFSRNRATALHISYSSFPRRKFRGPIEARIYP